MSFYARFIRPSAKIESPVLRLKAEIGTWLVLVRTIFLAALFTMVFILGYRDPNVLVGVIALSVVAYLISRTKYYQVAIAIIIAEPVIVITSLFFRATGDAADNLVAPTALVLGPLIASFVLSIRQTVLVTVVTCISFVLIMTAVPRTALPIIIIAFGTNVVISGLAILGSWLRDRAERTIEIDRAKFLQSSKLVSLGDMASGVAHELNTPLSAILLNAEMAEELLRHSTAPAEVSDHLLEIGAITQRMGAIITGLKDFSRDSENELAEVMSPTVSIRDALRLGEQKFKAADIQLEAHIEEGDDLLIPIRRVQLAQVVMHLLNNAFDAVHESKIRWVRLETRYSDEFFELIVTDSGDGISAKNRDRIFEPFFTTKDFGRGTGLGLSTSRGIALAHKGDLTHDPSSSNTRFVLQIPTKGHENKKAA